MRVYVRPESWRSHRLQRGMTNLRKQSQHCCHGATCQLLSQSPFGCPKKLVGIIDRVSNSAAKELLHALLPFDIVALVSYCTCSFDRKPWRRRWLCGFCLGRGLRSTVVWNCDDRCSMVAEHVGLTASIPSIPCEKSNLHNIPGLAIQVDIRER